MKDYFVYRAGPGKPSLRCLPDPFPREFSPREVGLLPLPPCGGDGKEGFVVAALMPLLNPLHRPLQPFDLHLFSSRDGSGGWRTVVPRLDPACQDSGRLLSHETSKVIVLGGGFMGWVDLWRGILICNVLNDDDPVLSLITLPKPMVAKRWKCYPGLIRDVTCINNLVTCVEIHFPKTANDHLPASYWDNTISDSDDSDNDSDSDTSNLPPTWTATIFKRRLFTSNSYWRKDSKVDSATILPADDLDVIPELRDAQSGKFTLENINCSAPVITMHDDGVVYMMSKLDNTGSQEGAWVLAFDVRKNTLKALDPCSVRRIFDFDAIFYPCTFSKYLGMVSGEEPVDISANYLRREEKLHKQPDFLIMLLLSVHDQLNKFEKALEFEINYRPIFFSTRASSLHGSIQRILCYAPRNSEDNEAVGKCIRALEDLEPWIAKLTKSYMPLSIDLVTRKINVALASIDSLLQTSLSGCEEIGSNSEANYDAVSSSVGLSPQIGAISIY